MIRSSKKFEDFDSGELCEYCRYTNYGLEDYHGEMKLGPNGGLVFCIEYLSQNMEWLLEELSQFDEDGYFMFDCPGID